MLRKTRQWRLGPSSRHPSPQNLVGGRARAWLKGIIMGFETLLEAVNASIAAATWLTPADIAGVELARRYARVIDDSEFGEAADVAKAFAIAGPNLQKTLTSLGLNPEARQELGAKGGVVEVDPIEELKKRRLRAVPAKITG